MGPWLNDILPWILGAAGVLACVALVRSKGFRKLWQGDAWLRVFAIFAASAGLAWCLTSLSSGSGPHQPAPSSSHNQVAQPVQPSSPTQSAPQANPMPPMGSTQQNYPQMLQQAVGQAVQQVLGQRSAQSSPKSMVMSPQNKGGQGFTVQRSAPPPPKPIEVEPIRKRKVTTQSGENKKRISLFDAVDDYEEGFEPKRWRKK